MEYGLGQETLAASLQKLLAQHDSKKRASLSASQQIHGLDASYQWQANIDHQQRAFSAMVNQMPDRTQEQRKLEDARRSLQAALVNWHTCYQEVQLGQPLIHGTAPANSQMVDQLMKLLSQKKCPVALPPGLAFPEANKPATSSPFSSSCFTNINEAAHPRYVPVIGQFFGKEKVAQREPQKMLHTNFTDKNTTVPEDFCAAAGTETETLRTHLQALLKFEAGCILIVRKINRLGFDSAQLLKEHFSLSGTVVEAYVAHSRVKPNNSRQSNGSRWRPSGLGFVVMSSADEAAAILEQGREHQICGCAIRVQKFERRAAMESLEKADDKQQDAPGLCEEDETLMSRVFGA